MAVCKKKKRKTNYTAIEENEELTCHIDQVIMEAMLRTCKIPIDRINMDGNSAVITPWYMPLIQTRQLKK